MYSKCVCRILRKLKQGPLFWVLPLLHSCVWSHSNRWASKHWSNVASRSLETDWSRAGFNINTNGWDIESVIYVTQSIVHVICLPVINCTELHNRIHILKIVILPWEALCFCSHWKLLRVKRVACQEWMNSPAVDSWVRACESSAMRPNVHCEEKIYYFYNRSQIPAIFSHCPIFVSHNAIRALSLVLTVLCWSRTGSLMGEESDQYYLRRDRRAV